MFPSASARANFFAVCLLSVTALVPTASAAQTLPLVDTSVRQSFERVLSDPRVKAALAAIERAEPEAIQEQFRLTEIPAPPFKEEKRAAHYLDLLKARGLDEAYLDEEGNSNRQLVLCTLTERQTRGQPQMSDHKQRLR